MTLLFVSPVEGQVGQQCNMTALPGETGSCSDLPGTSNDAEPFYCAEFLINPSTDYASCEPCSRAYDLGPGRENATVDDCARLFETVVFTIPTTTITNCALSCFNATRCYTDADCPADNPDCTVSISGPFSSVNDTTPIGPIPDPGECVPSASPEPPSPAPFEPYLDLMAAGGSS